MCFRITLGAAAAHVTERACWRCATAGRTTTGELTRAIMVAAAVFSSGYR